MTKLLKGLNPSKAVGPHEIHPRVLNELAMELGPVFAHLFQQSIDIGLHLCRVSLRAPFSAPCCFSLYINDISADIESEIRLFADDCVCYR